MADQLAVDLVLSDSELKNISISLNTVLMARRKYYCNVESRMRFLKVEPVSRRKCIQRFARSLDRVGLTLLSFWFFPLSVSHFKKQKYVCSSQTDLPVILKKTAITILEEAFQPFMSQVTVVNLFFTIIV